MAKILQEPKIPSKIIEAAKKEDLVVFFGAGVSRIIGCPSWQGFAEAYVDKLLEYDLINHFEREQLLNRDPRMTLTICQKILDENIKTPPDPKEVLKGDSKKIKNHQIYEELYKMNAIFVTTNFDGHMDDVIKRNRALAPSQPQAANLADAENVTEETITSKNIFSAEDDLLITTLKNGSLIHIHGSIDDPSNLVVTLPDYMRKYKKGTNHHELLKEIFNKKTVLFMGYGLEEYDIIEFLVKKSDIGDKEIKHYMLLGAFIEEKNMMDLYGKYYSTLGIELIPYSKTKHGHEQLVKVIKKWAKEIGSVATSKPYIEKRKLLDEID